MWIDLTNKKNYDSLQNLKRKLLLLQWKVIIFSTAVDITTMSIAYS